MQKMNLLEVIDEHERTVEGLNNIISQQNRGIKSLEYLLLQYMSIDEIAAEEAYSVDNE